MGGWARKAGNLWWGYLQGYLRPGDLLHEPLPAATALGTPIMPVAGCLDEPLYFSCRSGRAIFG